ncbi:MAG: tetratricopeptide repeat protein [Caulobacterales bacterium]|uniref:tetratricopeptide repeat protein n=1 Tax=Glycocaulis sp. TaxID=1969725 RepID=UPI003FA13577
MQDWQIGLSALVISAGAAQAQEAATDPYAELRAPAMAAYEAGETAQAYTLFEEVFTAIPQTDPAERAATAFSLAILAHQSEERARAIDWLQQGIALHEAAGTPPADYAQYIAYAGTISSEDGDNPAAIGWFRQALDVIPDADEARELRANTSNQLANAHNAAGEYYEASERRRNALSGYTQIYGPDHEFVGIVLEGLASDVEGDGHEAQAIDARREALRIAIANREPGDLTIVTLARTLADQMVATGNPDWLSDLADRIEAQTAEDRHRARILSELAVRASAGGLQEISADLHTRAYQAALADSETPPEFLATYLLNHGVGVENVEGRAAALPIYQEHYAMVLAQEGPAGERALASGERIWTALFRLARFADAEANARARVEALSGREDELQLQTGRAYTNLALAIHEQYRPHEAAPAFEQAQAILEGLEGGEDLLASLYDGYAIHLVFDSQREDALRIAQQNLALRGEQYGEDSASYGRGLHTLATVQRQLGQASEARASLEQALALYEAIGGSANDAQVDVLILLSQIIFDQGSLGEVEDILARVDGMIAPSRTDQRRDWHDEMGRLRRHQGRLTEALSHYREVLALRVAQDGPEARANVYPLLQIGVILRLQGNLEEAEAMIRRALAIHQSYGVTSGSDLGVAWSELATVLQEQGRRTEALEASRQANMLIAEAWPRGTTRRALQDYNYAILIMNGGQYGAAEAPMRQAIGDYRQLEDHSAVFLGAMMNALGFLLEQIGRYEEAADAYQEGLALREPRLSSDHPALASGRAFMGALLVDHMSQPEEGLAYFRQASAGLIEGILLRAGTEADEGADGVEFAQKDAFFSAHLEALWDVAHSER